MYSSARYQSHNHKRMKHNYLFSLLAMLFISMRTIAAPAYPGGIVKTQPDGSTITVFMHGDEYFHYFTTADGTHVEQNAEGYFVPVDEEAFAVRRAAGERRRAARRVAPNKTATAVNLAPRGLVILANFSDKTMQASNTQTAFHNMLNADTYTDNGAYGSARRYFKEQSYGKYIPDFDVVGPVTAPNTMAYYGGNDADGNDQNAELLIRDVCQLVDDEVDFSNYDADNDGKVDFVFVVYAGYGEAEGGGDNTIWPHQWDLGSAGVSLTLDGKRVYSYACSSELAYSTKKRAGIGTFCHEFSHVLGLRDLYPTDGGSHKTQGDWDIMSSGNYNNDGNTPPSYSAYERFMLGWLEPTILNEATTTTLHDIQSNEEAYIITSTGKHNLDGADPNPTSFFLLENRQKTAWDQYLPGHGMIITKVNYNYSNWYYNRVNNTESSQGVDLIEADGVTSSSKYGKLKDAFPSGAKAYTPYSNYPITNITETSGVITFDFMGGGGEDVTGVTVSPSSDYLFLGDELQLTATVKPTTAVNKNVTWSTSNAAVATVSSTGLVTPHACGSVTITVRTEDGGYTATSELEVPCEYTVTVTSNNAAWGSVTGGGTFYDGDKATLTATPASGYVFNQWSDGNRTNPRTITVSSDLTLQAEFVKEGEQTLALKQGKYVVVAKRSSGNFFYMTSDLGTASTKRYQAVDTKAATLSAVPAEDLDAKYIWEVVYSGSNIKLKNSDGQFSTWSSGNSAIFDSTGKELGITVNDDGAYSIYIANTPERIIALNTSNDYFAYYSDSGIQSLYFLPYTEPEPAVTYLVTATSNNEAWGTVSGGGEYEEGATATLTATAKEGYEFVKWSDNNTTNPRTITVNTAITLEATFAARTKYTVTVSSNNTDFGTVSGGKTVYEGESLTITATPKTNYVFSQWSDGNTDNPRTLTPTSDMDLTATFLEKVKYTVTVNSNNDEWGTVTGGATVYTGEKVTLTATPAEGYAFNQWSDGNRTNPRTITVTSALTLTAEFAERVRYTVTVASSDETMGTVSGGGTVYEGETVTITATPNAGYKFVKWSDDNTANPRTFTPTEDLNLTATFMEKAAQSFALAEGKYVVVAKRSTGNFFYMTSDLGSSGTKRYQAVDAGTSSLASVVTQDKESQYIWEVVYGDNGILLKIDGLYSTWTTKNSATLAETGMEINVTENTNGSYKLALIDEPKRVLALNETANNNFFAYYEDSQIKDLYFLPYGESAPVVTYTITVTSADETQGTVSGGGTYNEGATATITAIPKSGYTFAQWSDGNADNPRAITVTSDLTLTATFTVKEVVNYTVTVATNNADWGTVSGGGTYAEGTQATIEATANTGYTFKQWDDGVTTNPRTVTVNSDVTYTATFTEKPAVTYAIAEGKYVVVAKRSSGNYWYMTGTVSSTRYTAIDTKKTDINQVPAKDLEAAYIWEVEYGTNGILLKHGSQYSTWSTGNAADLKTKASAKEITVIDKGEGKYWLEIDAETSTKRYLALNQSGAYFAYYKSTSNQFQDLYFLPYTESAPAVSYTVTVMSNNDTWGTVTGGGTYEEGATATLTATPNTGYTFVQWSDGDTNASRTITVNGDVTLTATFAAKATYTFTITSDNIGGTVTGSGTYYEGDEVTITATAVEGYEFVRWSDGNTDATRTIVATEDVTLAAEFTERLKYTVTTTSNNDAWGRVTGGATVYAGESVTLTATASAGYVFTQWSDGDITNPRTIIVTEDISLMAQFEAKTYDIRAGKYVVVAKHANGNFLYMTSDLGTATTKRYQAVDTGTDDITQVVKTNKEDKYIWEVVYGTKGIKLKNNNQYSTFISTSDKSANFNEEGDELTATHQEGDIYTIQLVETTNRYLSLNNSNNYFAYYKGTQINNLYFLPYTETVTITTTTTWSESETTLTNNDIVISNGATLICDTDEKAASITIQEGGTLQVNSGATLSVTKTITAQSEGDAQPQIVAEGTITYGAFQYVKRIPADRYYFFSLPFDCATENVTIDGVPAVYDTDWNFRYYDGAGFAEKQSNENFWLVDETGTIQANRGYAIGVNDDKGVETLRELVFTATDAVDLTQTSSKTIAVAANPSNNDAYAGWNFVMNPYTSAFNASVGGLNIPYISVPEVGQNKTYKQCLSSEVDLLPFYGFFVQVEADGELTFTPNDKAPSAPNQAASEQLMVGVTLSNGAKSDETSLVIGNQFTDAYEIGSDLQKMLGYGDKPQVYTYDANTKYAFHSLSEVSAAKPQALGIYLPAAGEYTFALKDSYEGSRVQAVYLHDYEANQTINLLQTDYAFSSSEMYIDTRFALSVVLAPSTATALDSTTETQIAVWQDGRLQVKVDGAKAGDKVRIYDVHGQLVTKWTVTDVLVAGSVPQGGLYIVEVMHAAGVAVEKVIVE